MVRAQQRVIVAAGKWALGHLHARIVTFFPQHQPGYALGHQMVVPKVRALRCEGVGGRCRFEYSRPSRSLSDARVHFQ